MTLISRISGLVRDVVMANLLGAGALADAFYVAFRIPNFLRRIFGEGAFSQAFVPVFSELNETNTREAKEFVDAAAGFLMLATLMISVLGVIFAPQIITVFAPGYLQAPEKLEASADALRVMFPYLFCISMVAMAAGILNTRNRFAVPSATPIVLNICLILAALYLIPVMDNSAKALAIGVMVAGALQLLIQLPALLKEGYLPRPKIDRNNPNVKKLFRLILPTVFSASVAQINTVINTILASFLVTGSVSWLYYSDRLMEFPVGVFGIALATVVLPSLSKVWVGGNPKEFSELMDWALRWVLLIALPAAVALWILSVPLLATMFQYNAFTVNDVEMSAQSLMAYSVGVCGFIFIKVLAPGFFARQDTKTPMKIAVTSVIANLIMSLILVQFLAHAGLALSISLAAWLNAGLLYWQLRRLGVYQPQQGWLLFLIRLMVAITVMALVLNFLTAEAADWYAWSLFERMWNLSIVVTAGAGSYFICLFVTGMRPQQMLFRPN